MGLAIGIHGDSGTGKSTLADTAPGPRLVLDVEGGARLMESEFVVWENVGEAPPAVEGNVNVIVDVLDYPVFEKTLQWLQSGRHPFRSLVLDSLTELQKRCIDSLVGVNPMMRDNWGTLLREIEFKVRSLKDLIRNPHNPLDMVVMICLSQSKDGKQLPSLQGAIVNNFPAYVDIMGCTTLDIADGAIVQKFQVFPLNGVAAKSRGKAGNRLISTYGAFITNPNLSNLLQVVETNPQEVVA